MATLGGGLPSTLSSTVDLRISCSHLKDKDVGSKSDPCVVFYIETKGKWNEVGRTEQVKNNHDPTFTKALEIQYFFEEVQKLKFCVYDIDNTTTKLSDDDFLGEMECTLAQIISSSPFTRPLTTKSGGKTKSTITISGEERSSQSNDIITLTFRAEKLDKKDTFGKSDPYLEFSRQGPDGKWLPVHRSEVINNNLNPAWRPIILSMHTLFGADVSKPIKIDCYDFDKDGSHDLIGGCETTFKEFSQAAEKEMSWPCVNPKKAAKKKGYTKSGTIFLGKCTITKGYTFLDFVFGGLQINFFVGIDFTGSNGDPKHPQSLHYIDPYKPNEYMQAIAAVGAVCEEYDSDKMFPALGFGAVIVPGAPTSHEFAVNFNAANPFCAGIQGIIEAYRNCIPRVSLSGPTNASPIIYHVAQFAQAAQQHEFDHGATSYYTLLMLTDGVLSDMSNTIEAIVYASGLPMSIILVGVGGADFSAMEALDGDDGVLKTSRGDPVKRDIVQFVPFRNFKQAGPVELARHVLAEVPKQVTEYYRQRGIPPPVRRPQPPPAQQLPPTQQPPPQPTTQQAAAEQQPPQV